MSYLDGHIMAVKKEVEEGRTTPTDSIGMQTLNLDEFLINHKGGKTNIAELVELKEHIDNVISSISSTIQMFIKYHKDSPRYWGTLEKDEEYKEYAVSINLENFMHEESEGKEVIPGECFISNNYVLADKVVEAYRESGGDIKGINSDEHFRDQANWKFKSKAKAKKFVKFIDKTYVKPSVEERIEDFNIKKINFGETQITFEYKNESNV